MSKENHPLLPSVGEWYLDLETEDEFRIVDVDEDNGIIEIQYFNGDIGDLGSEEWNSRELSKIEAPEDWIGALEPVEEGDINYDQESFELPPKHAPLPGFEQDDLLQAEEANPHEEIPGSDAED